MHEGFLCWRTWVKGHDVAGPWGPDLGLVPSGCEATIHMVPVWAGRENTGPRSRASVRDGRACHGLRSGSQPYSSSASSEAPAHAWGRWSPGEKPEAAGEDP